MLQQHRIMFIMLQMGSIYLVSCHCCVYCTLVLYVFFILWQINSLFSIAAWMCVVTCYCPAVQLADCSTRPQTYTKICKRQTRILCQWNSTQWLFIHSVYPATSMFLTILGYLTETVLFMWCLTFEDMWHMFIQIRCPSCYPTNSSKALNRTITKFDAILVNYKWSI